MTEASNIRIIPVKVLVDDEYRCRGEVQILVDDRETIHQQLIVQSGVLDGVTAERVSTLIIDPLDAFAYIAMMDPDYIGRDQ